VERATELAAPILVGGDTSAERAVLSTWALSPASAAVVARALAALPGLTAVDVSDIVAGRPEAEALEVYRVLSEAFAALPGLVDLDLSDNAFGPKVGQLAGAAAPSREPALQQQQAAAAAAFGSSSSSSGSSAPTAAAAAAAASTTRAGATVAHTCVRGAGSRRVPSVARGMRGPPPAGTLLQRGRERGDGGGAGSSAPWWACRSVLSITMPRVCVCLARSARYSCRARAPPRPSSCSTSRST
jgi:hypothetical protein